MAPDRDTRSTHRALRVLHWNIHSWQDSNSKSNVDRVAGLIRDTSPDVVSLVEVDEVPWGHTGNLAQLAEQCGYHWTFTPTFEFGDDHHPRGGFGNALLSRTPFTATQQWQLVWPTPLYDSTEPTEPRSVVFAQTCPADEDEAAWFGAAHLPRSDHAARMSALQRLGALLGQLPTPWLLCADFNIRPESWIDTAPAPLLVAPNPALPTYPDDNPMEPIDYCVTSTGQIRAEVLAEAGSDHLPVLAHWEPRAGS